MFLGRLKQSGIPRVEVYNRVGKFFIKLFFLMKGQPLYQNEVKRSAFDMEMCITSHANKSHFHRKVVHLVSF